MLWRWRRGTCECRGGGLVEMVDNDIPPIIRTISLKNIDISHFSVIKGYDLNQKRFIVNDPGNLRISRLDFTLLENIWIVGDPEQWR